MEIYELIRRYRIDNNISQKDLAKSCGISQNYLSEIEHGLKEPSLEVKLKIAKALNVCPYNLIHLCDQCPKKDCQWKFFLHN